MADIVLGTLLESGLPKRSAGRRRPPRLQPLEPQGALVVVCRGGECGDQSRHPGFDHAERLRVLRQSIDAGITSVAISTCLDACEHSNVVVVVPGADQREAAVTPIWLGGVLTPEATKGVVGCISAGGPGSEPPPPVDILTFAPTRLSRRELEEPGTLSGRGTTVVAGLELGDGGTGPTSPDAVEPARSGAGAPRVRRLAS